MSDLFSDAAKERLPEVAPLALRMRPQSLDEFVGQEQVLGKGSALRVAIEEDRVRSTILYGPPGTGKTTLARIIARMTGAEFVELSAVSATVAQVREVLAGARERLGAHGRRTILFLDEIHRFNKAQQDALLPGVEEGVITLIGATTENPYFEVNSALLSRRRSTSSSRCRRRAGDGRARGARARRRVADELAAADRDAAGGDARSRSTSSSSRGRRRRPQGAARESTSRTRAQASARLRQGGRRALRLHLGVHQVDARLRSRTRASTTSRRCSRAARTRATSRGA
jgi:putative ATPase